MFMGASQGKKSIHNNICHMAFKMIQSDKEFNDIGCLDMKSVQKWEAVFHTPDMFLLSRNPKKDHCKTIYMGHSFLRPRWFRKARSSHISEAKQGWPSLVFGW